MAKIVVKHSDKCMTIHATGTITYDEILTTLEQNGSQILRDLIWDCSAVDNIQITSDEIMGLPKIARKYMVNRAAGGKTALVSSVPHVFGIFNQYAVYAEISKQKYSVMTFRTLAEASRWIEAE